MSRILIIDDDTAMSQMLTEHLTYDGYHVVTADDGRAGIEAARTHRPDLIICDLHMPEMDGFSVFRHLRKDDQLADVPFIFLSGATDCDVIRRGMVLGADDFLSKPFNMDELNRVMRVRLAQSERRRAMLTNAIEELRLNITRSLPHELRTAIMIIEGYANLALEDADGTDPVQQSMVEAIRDNAARLRHMAEKYLWYLKTHIPGHLDGVGVTSGAEAVLEFAALDIAQQFDRAADLNLQVEPAPTVKVDGESLKKIVEEIVENACKFSKPGTPITVHGTPDAHDYVITICDQGHGIDAEQIEQIGGFMQFDRTTHEQQGAGLGLIIAKRLIERSGGALNIESTVGDTVVTIRLPVEVSMPV